MKNALIIFVRNPEIGKVKTRFVNTLGDEKALDIYKELLQYTFEIASATIATKYVFYFDKTQAKDIERQWFFESFKKMATLAIRWKPHLKMFLIKVMKAFLSLEVIVLSSQQIILKMLLASLKKMILLSGRQMMAVIIC